MRQTFDLMYLSSEPKRDCQMFVDSPQATDERKTRLDERGTFFKKILQFASSKTLNSYIAKKFARQRKCIFLQV